MAKQTPTWEEQKPKCINELKAVLDRFNAVFDPYAIIRNGQAEIVINVVPKPAEPVTPPKAPEPSK
jgi:hypothetical protein